MIKTLQSYIIFVLLLVAQNNSPMQTIAHNIEIPFAWNCMKLLDIQNALKCYVFCVKCSRLNALPILSSPFHQHGSRYRWSHKNKPRRQSCASQCVWIDDMFIIVYLILFDHIWLVSACALRICFGRNAARSQTPLHWSVISVAPTCFEPGVPFVVVGISEQWTDTSKYDPGTRPKPPGSLSKEQQASAATIWSHLMHDWLRDDTRIFESQISKYCSCKNTTLLITSAYAKFKNSLLDQNVKWQFKIGPLGYAKTCKD